MVLDCLTSGKSSPRPIDALVSLVFEIMYVALTTNAEGAASRKANLSALATYVRNGAIVDTEVPLTATAAATGLLLILVTAITTHPFAPHRRV